MGTQEELREFLDEHPEKEDALQSVLEIDREHGQWSFQDVPVDSGTFGEVVSRGIVESDGDAYALADRQAVASVLDDTEPDHGRDTGSDRSGVDVSLSDIETPRGYLLGVSVALGLVMVLRVVTMYDSVFRAGTVVLAGNDPYLYRFWIDTLLASQLSAFDPAALPELPERLRNHDVLLVVVLWWVTALLGGTSTAGGLVLAWYPVVAALLMGVLVYLGGAKLTGDRRIGVVAVLLLAVSPAHGLRTALGFADHHAFDYLLIAVSLTCLVFLSVERRDSNETVFSTEALLVSGVLGVAMAAQVFAWRAGALLIAPVGLYVGMLSVSTVSFEKDVFFWTAPILVGLTIGAAFALVVHLGFGWGQRYRGLAPLVLLASSVVLVGLALAGERIGLDARGMVVLEIVGGGSAAAVSIFVLPGGQLAVSEFVNYIFVYGGTQIQETKTLFEGQGGALFSHLFLFGFVLFFALPYGILASASVGRRHQPGVLGVLAYFWPLLLLTFVQRRFAGELTIPLVIVAAVGFVHFAGYLDIADESDPLGLTDDHVARDPSTPRIPDWSTIRAFTMLFLLIGGFGLIQTPVHASKTTIGEANYQTAMWISQDAESDGLSYPQSYVFSEWGRNRVYNYYVNGESEHYTFAKQNFEEFLASSKSERWYRFLRGRTGYVVTPTPSTTPPAATNYHLLHVRNGARGSQSDGSGHYRLVFVSKGGERKVFRLVPGARITGSVASGDVVRTNTTVKLADRSFTYDRRTKANEYGDIGITVAYPGTYTINGRRINVSESDVVSGNIVGDYRAHWTFDEGSGSETTDPIGGAIGRLRGTRWVDGVRGRALSFAPSRESRVVAPDGADLTGAASFTICGVVDPNATTADGRHDVINLGGYELLLSYVRAGDRTGWEVFMETSEGEANVVSLTESRADDWTVVCGRYDGGTLSLWVNGERVGHTAANGTIVDKLDRTVIGSDGNDQRFFSGRIDDIWVYSRPLPPEELESLAANVTAETEP